ncbi:mitochondrial Homoaconitase [Quaeritorhiza haematococci]|nr:mitochondrial Homoaconitase [Quaeritorhiza haematococci]
MIKLRQFRQGASALTLASTSPSSTPWSSAPRSCCRRAFAVASSSYAVPPQNLVEKIVQKYAVDLPQKHRVQQGDFVTIQPEHVMTHDNTAAVMNKFQSIGAGRVRNPKQPVFTLDHDVQNTSDKNLAKYRGIEEFARRHGVDFYPAGRGIGHQIMIEEGYAFPGTLTVASDSHSNMYGGIGSLGTPVVRTDAAAIWATGRTWWQIPPVARVELVNKLSPGVTGKDVIVTLCGLFNKDEVLNHAVEFAGEGVSGMSIDDRLTIANMTTEWGALAGVFPVDKITIDWLQRRASILASRQASKSQHPRINAKRVESLVKSIQANPSLSPLLPDSNAYYAKDLTLDLATVSPYVSGPNSVKVAQPLYKLEQQNIRVHKAYLVSCVNSRASDIQAAAKVMKGRKVSGGVEFYIAAASSEVQKEMEASGDWGVLIQSGARPLPAGCGPCIGLGTGLLKDNEVGISATNRNFKGRMGSPNALAYLSSPEVVAASAVAGKICGPSSLPPLNPVSIVSSTEPAVQQLPKGTLKVNKPTTASKTESTSSSASSDVVSGFPGRLTGEIIFCDTDNLNTDGIYPGKYTYQEDISPQKMAQVVMENYDPAFSSIVKKSDILVSGFNFGTGSSREQAATALRYAGVPLVLAGSFSETFKRNALNNALLVLECADLVNDLRSAYKASEKTLSRRTGAKVDIDLVAGKVVVVEGANRGKEYRIPSVGKAAQELVAEGGLENWVKNRIQQ